MNMMKTMRLMSMKRTVKNDEHDDHCENDQMHEHAEDDEHLKMTNMFYDIAEQDDN